MKGILIVSFGHCCTMTPAFSQLLLRILYIPPKQVHCNNMFSRGVRMFRQASCYFRSGSEWEADPVTFRPVVDRVSQSARFITVPLGDRTANAIKCRFHFSDLWLLFSEVAFQSGKAESLPDVSHWAGFLSFHVS